MATSMSTRARLAPLVFLLAFGNAFAGDDARTWDGLESRKVKGLDQVHVRPGVEFKAYADVLLDAPVEVAFDRNWDPNNGVRSVSRQTSTKDIQRIQQQMSTGFREAFAEELGKGGYSLVDAIGDRTLRVTAAIADVYINAPDRMAPGRSTSYTMEAGRMTLVMELRDGPTGQLLARVVDEKSGTDTGSLQMTTSATNSAEFRRAVRSWAGRLVEALDKLNGKD